MIDDSTAARRLARAICADVQLYNAATIQGMAPADAARALGPPLREGRQLYVSRVTTGHLGIFDEVAREMCERLGIPYHPSSDESPAEPYRAMPMAAAHPPVPPRATPGVPPALVALIALACAIAGAATFFVLSR